MNDDTVNRQAALDALADYIHNVDRVYSTGQLTHEDCMDAAHSVLDKLPSAQPDVPDTNVGDMISRQAAIWTIRKAKDKSEAHRMLIQLPNVDAVPVVHGRWIDETFKAWGLVHHPYKCDQCGYHSEAPSDYCPDCGARMDGEDGDDNC